MVWKTLGSLEARYIIFQLHIVNNSFLRHLSPVCIYRNLELVYKEKNKLVIKCCFITNLPRLLDDMWVQIKATILMSDYKVSKTELERGQTPEVALRSSWDEIHGMAS